MPKVKPLIYSPDRECRELAINIKTRMLRNGMQQRDLAEALNVSAGTVSIWLSKPARMKIEDICRIAHILKVDKTELMKEVI